VNSNLVLGFYAGDFGGGQAAAGNGQLTILTNGIVRAIRLRWANWPPLKAQPHHDQRRRTLDVTNTIGNATITLPSMINNAARIFST